MGNITLGRKKSTKVMKIDGETMKFRTPIYANEVLKNYPSMVLLESEEVKHFGVRAKPLEPQQELKPKRLYFLIELPKFSEENKKIQKRARSAIQMSATERLEMLMLARRSVSDLTTIKPTNIMSTQECSSFFHNNNSASDTLDGSGSQTHPVRLKLRLSKAVMEKLMMESKDENEVAEKIMRLYVNNNNGASGPLMEEQNHNNGGIVKKGLKSREKRVGFSPITEEEIQLAVAAS